MIKDIKKIIKNFNYREMEYRKNRGVEILLKGKYKDYSFFIVNYGTHPCAYVEIPKNHKYFGIGYDEIDIYVHGGLTFSNNDFFYNPIVIENKWFIGWDYAHYGDYIGHSIKFEKFYSEDDHKWTTEKMFEDVVEVIEQLIKAEEE